jgi:ABC-type multidrug transport system fused ATPase/permease subunit
MAKRYQIRRVALAVLEEDGIFAIAESGPGFTGNSIRIPFYRMFSTHGERKIISQGRNIVLEQGLNTAIIAKTGGGKSSLLRGLLRIYSIEGEVSFFGADTKRVSRRTLVEALHYVPQSPFFFAGTLRENLSYGLDDVFDAALTAVLQQACLYDELSADGNPLEKLLQEGGKPLSGGQVKRLAIARAFLRSPKLYLFNEAFTGIDPATLSVIFGNLDKHLDKTGGRGSSHIPRAICERQMPRQNRTGCAVKRSMCPYGITVNYGCTGPFLPCLFARRGQQETGNYQRLE